MEPVIFRNSLRHLMGTWLTRLLPLGVVVSALDRYAATWPWWWFEIFVAVLVAVTIPVLMAPVWAARFRTLTVDGDVLTLHTGWFAPETRVTKRAQISSVQVDEPLSQRLSGVRAVTILTSGVTSSTITMPALLPADAVALERLLVGEGLESDGTTPAQVDDEVAGPSTAPGPAGPADAERAGEGLTVLYRATGRDIAATSLSTGYVVVMAVAALGAAQEIGGLAEGTSFAISWADPRVWLLAIVGVVVATAVLIAARFSGFRIEQTGSGQLRIVYGAVERTAHTISPGQVVAVTLVRTPVDLVLGTTRLVFSTAWLADGSHKRLVFPSMPREVAARVVTDAVGRQLPELYVERRGWWVAGPVLAVALTAAVVLGSPDLGPWGTAAVVGGGLVVGMLASRYLLSAVSVSASADVVCRRASLSHRVTVYSPGAARSVVERRVPGIPLRNVTVLGWAHRRFVHRVPARSARTAAEVRAALRATADRVEASLLSSSPRAHGGNL